MSGYEHHPPPMAAYQYGASHMAHHHHPPPPPGPPGPPGPPPPGPPSHTHHPHHHQPPYQHHAPPQYQQPPPPAPPPSSHQTPGLPPMPQYAGQVAPAPPMPSQMPPPDMPGNGVPPQGQLVSKPPQSLEPVSRQDDEGRTYRLDVVQQPKRARMCGFGDKDRRPITPPPCVRLIIVDPATGKEVDCNEIDQSMYVLNVDLWSGDGQEEVNLVKSSNSAPSISSTTPVSYTGVADNSYHPILPSNTAHRDGQYPPPPSAMGYPPQQAQPQPSYSPGYGAPPPFPGAAAAPQNYGQPNGYPPNPAYPGYNGAPSSDYGRSEYGSAHFHARNAIGAAGSPQGMYTRNLIGSLAASAFRLSDTTDHIGIWFILQDLSIRTEGTFRLRFSFVNVCPPSRALNGSTAQGSVSKAGRAPILACCFSDPFTVFSAKKFPGVCESTPLSKCFASQGIKIPIRKEGDNKKSRDDDDDYE